MTTTIPACKDCKHFTDSDYFFDTCKFHTFERPDYINGRVHKIEMIAVEAREQENRCGVEGKNFEQKEVVEEEEEYMSFWEYFKGFFTKNWMF